MLPRFGGCAYSAQFGGGLFGRNNVDHDARTAFETSNGGQLGEQVNVPVERAVVVVRSSVKDQVERHIFKQVIEVHERIADGSPNSGKVFVGRVGQMHVVMARDNQNLVRAAAPPWANCDSIFGGKQDSLARHQFGFDSCT